MQKKAPVKKRKTAEYVPVIKSGIPVPERAQTVYTEKIAEGKLIEVAERIKPTECVHLPSGSIGKFRKLLKQRGLKARVRYDGPVPDATVWAISSDDEAISSDDEK